MSKFRIWYFVILLLGVMNLCFDLNRAAWLEIGFGIPESEIRAFVSSTENNAQIFIGTAKAVYQSENKGRDFKAILNIPGSDKKVNFLYIAPDYLSPSNPPLIYAATNSGLFMSADSGKNWQRIFYANDAKERQCLWVAADENTLYLATAGGLFSKDISQNSWTKGQGVLSHAPVYVLAQDEQYLYVASDREVFRIDKEDQGMEKIFSTAGKEINGEAEETAQDESNIWARQIKALLAVGKTEPQVCVVAAKGIFVSRDSGHTWERKNSEGVPLESVTSAAVLDFENILLSTTKGVFAGNGGPWVRIYQGMETSEVNFLNTDSAGNIYAATNKGIFLLTDEKALPSQNYSVGKNGEGYFSNEPPIAQVHKMAVDYAEVSPDKIKGWRRAASHKAWLPTLNIGLDQDKNKTIDDSVFGTSSSGGSAFIGPNDKSFDDNFGWDVSLSWDLGDLVWNADQTSIDSRSKLMVELREDILDQVTRIYFERRRIQKELAVLPNLSEQEKLDKQMRMEELTALVDGFTGGEFSRRIEEMQK